MKPFRNCNVNKWGERFLSDFGSVHCFDTLSSSWPRGGVTCGEQFVVVLTADKGVALVVMDKSQYVDKCMVLLNDTKVYKPCKDTTKKLHRDVQETLWQLNRDHGSSRLSWWSKNYYNKLLPTGNSSPAPRFYGLPKIHKANCPMWPIVSACGTATYQLAKFLTKILQRYTGITPTFVKDSKCFSEYLRTVHIGKDEELVSFNVSALFTSIPVPTALDVINQLFPEHIEVPEARGKYGCSFKQNTIGLTKDEVMQLLKLVLENCVFSFQGNFFKQLHSAAMGSPCSPVVANICMEYFKDMALGPELPLPIKEWKRYVDVCLQHYPKGPMWYHATILKLHWSTHKIHCRTTKQGRCYPLLGHPSQTQRWGDICLWSTGNPHTLTGTWTSTQVTLFQPKEPW